MKTLKETFIIVDSHKDNEDDFFLDYVSFNRFELETKCIELNKELNKKFEKEHEEIWEHCNKSLKKKINQPYTTMNIFKVMNLTEAIDKFHSGLAEYYSEQDESY